MKKKFAILLFFLVSILNVNAEIYLISSRAIKDWASVEHKGHWFTTTYNAFPDFESLFNSEYFKPNSTIYVESGTYSQDITINAEGLTILGNNAFSDWTAERKEESIITGNIYIKTSNVTINGFKFTGNGRIESSNGTNAKPLSGIKVLHNYFTGSTLERDNSNPLVEIGYMVGNENASTVSAQCRYKDCEVSHNYFEGDATHYACCISMGGVYGTTTVIDNYFYDGGTSLWIANAQGTLNIKNNVFKNVGKTTFTAPDGGNKGDFCIAIYRSAFANSTTANIIANEFDGCYGQGSVFPLIRIFHGSLANNNVVNPQNYRVNINENTFKNKVSVFPDATDALGGSNFVLYHDDDTGKDVRFNISGNHFDNRFYKLSWVTLDDDQGLREVYADQFTYFDCTGGTMSDFYSSLAKDSNGDNVDVSYHAKKVELKEVTVLQSFDIDPLTGDMYFIQKMGSNSNSEFNNKYGFVTNHDGLCITRVPCTNIDGYYYTYSTNIESMNIGYGGHGTNICTVRDKNGELWIWGGGNAEVNANNDKSATTARFQFKKDTDINLNVSSDNDKVKIFNVLNAGNEYPACDETSRLLCVYTTTSSEHTYYIYNLDDALEGKQILLKTFKIKVGQDKQSFNNDNGYNTWPLQSFDINGDYLYILEGSPKGNDGNIVKEEPTIVVTLYNWRTGNFIYRKVLDYGRMTGLTYGEPQGLVIRHDKYGHAIFYIALVNGDEGARKVNIFKFIIDYHTKYDGSKQVVVGGDTNKSAHFKNDYPTVSYSHTPSLGLSTTAIGAVANGTVTINNGNYLFGEWYGVVTGEDADAFDVTINKNNAFSESVTANVSFSIKHKNTTKNAYNATLRLFSPLASTNVESNDIIIPLSGTYSGPTTAVDKTSLCDNISIKIENKTLSIENAQVEYINVYSTTGALVASISDYNSIDLSHLNGVYIVSVKSTEGISHTSKVILK